LNKEELENYIPPMMTIKKYYFHSKKELLKLMEILKDVEKNGIFIRGEICVEEWI
jgi:hypothetical protein